jgi:predicted acyltransferase
MGSNAILVYLASEFLDEALGWVHWASPAGRISLRGWIYTHIFAGLGGPYNASLFFAIAYVLVLYLFAWFLYRRGWFVRV